ncbi:MAG: hypothetical protein GF398_03825 [Chitinivibrionales bacterium]|nr:hypothetical protein [Chitinivibrionales bacterium]
MPELFDSLNRLYRRLPEVACTGCGSCCVSPTCTLIEFNYLISCAGESLAEQQLQKFIFSPPHIHPRHDGNLRCALLSGTQCTLHPGRTGSCRLFGVPTLKHFNVKDLVECEHDIRTISGDDSPDFIRNWIRELFELNNQLYAFDTQPYYISGLNLECWLDIYFDDSLYDDTFADIRKAMHASFDLTRFKSDYFPRTNFKEKVDKISIFTALLDSGDVGALTTVLQSIKNDYPLTGTWFLKEADVYLAKIDALAAQQANP